MGNWEGDGMISLNTKKTGILALSVLQAKAKFIFLNYEL